MKAVVRALIYSTSNSWKVAEPGDAEQFIQERTVSLEIKGNTEQGYHLIKSPEGCFRADSWHKTIEEATEVAQELFGVGLEEWD